MISISRQCFIYPIRHLVQQKGIALIVDKHHQMMNAVVVVHVVRPAIGAEMPRDFAARKDANHSIIVEMLQWHGYIVVETYRSGFGAPDFFCLSKAKRWVAFEVKSEKGGKLSKLEADLFDRCGVGAPLFVVRTPEGALELMAHFDNPVEPYLTDMKY